MKSKMININTIVITQLFVGMVVLDADEVRPRSAQVPNGSPVGTAAVQKKVDAIIKEGTWDDALREYYILEEKSKKNPAYQVQLQRLRDGLRGATALKKYNRAKSTERRQLFDPVKVEAKIKEVFGNDITVQEFIDQFGNIGELRSQSRIAITSDGSTKTTEQREEESERLQRALQVLDMVDSEYSKKVEGIEETITKSLDTTRGITRKPFAIDKKAIENLTQKYWSTALETYYNISLDRANRKELPAIVAGLKGESGKYQRVKNQAKSVYPFDVLEVIKKIEEWPTDVLSFITEKAGYWAKSQAIELLDGGNILWMIYLRDQINKAASIVALMDPEDAARFRKLNEQIDAKLQPKIAMLTRGEWWQALDVYYQAYQSAEGNPHQMEWLEGVIVKGLKGESDWDEFNRKSDPIDAPKIIEILDKHYIEPNSFFQECKDRETYKRVINADFKGIKGGSDKDNDAKLGALIERLKNDEACIKELKDNDIFLLDPEILSDIQKALKRLDKLMVETKEPRSATQTVAAPVVTPVDTLKPALVSDLAQRSSSSMDEVD